MVFGLDHLVSEQDAEPGEIDAIREWLDREGTCLLLAPHHDVGFTGDMQQHQMEYKHHGDELVPRQQRFGQYTRSLMKGLEVPVLNQFGLRPAVVPGTDQIAPSTINKDLDELGLLNGVTTFNFHLHLPHYALTTEDTKSIRVLARQPIDLSRPHPFTAAGNREFNSFLWMPPNGARGGDILLADSTIFTTLFGGTESLEHFWRNMAKLREDDPRRGPLRPRRSWPELLQGHWRSGSPEMRMIPSNGWSRSRIRNTALEADTPRRRPATAPPARVAGREQAGS